MRNNKGWTGKELSRFLNKYGIERGWKTILNDIKRGVRIWAVNKVRGRVTLSEETAKKFIRFILETKKKNIESTGIVNKIVEDLNIKTKKHLSI